MKNFFKNPKNIGVIILVLASAIFFSGLTKNKVADDKLSEVSTGLVEEVVSSSGSVEAGGLTEVFSPTVGIIKKVLVVDGDVVKKDQPLFEVTSTATAAEKSAALADLLSARSALKKAENDRNTLQSSLESGRRAILDIENTKKIFEENVLAQKPNPTTGRAYTDEEKLSMSSSIETTRKNFTNLEKQYLDASDSIRSAQAALSEANVAYKATMDSVTNSPIAGVVSNLKRTIGNSVDKEKAVLVVKSSPDLLIEINVSEFNIGKIKKEQMASVTFDALPAETVSAKVLGVDAVGNESLGTVSYGVTIMLLPTADQLEIIRPAMTANVSIVTNKNESALSLPRSAIKLEGGKYFVLKSVNKALERTEVVVGILGTEKVELKSGLNIGDKVLTVFEEKDEK